MGKPGPRPLPNELKRLAGNPGKRKLPASDPAVMPVSGDVKPPSFLLPAAKRQWKKIVPELHAAGLLSGLDLDAVAAYCTAYATWVDAVQLMKDKDFRMMTVDRFGMPAVNPLVKVVRDAQAEMVKMLSEFGMTPSSRSRVPAAPDGEDADEFDQIAGMDGGRGA